MAGNVIQYQGFYGATNMDAVPIPPITTGLLALSVPVLSDPTGGLITVTGDKLTRLTTNYAPGASAGTLLPPFSQVGTIDQTDPAMIKCTHANYLNLNALETRDMTLMYVGQSTASNTGTDLFAPFGDFNTAVVSSAQLYFNTGTSARFQVSLMTVVGSFVGSIAAGVLTVASGLTGTIVPGSTHHVVASGIAHDIVIGAQLSGTAGGIGTYTIADATIAVAAGTTMQYGTILNTSASITLPDVSSVRCISGRVASGVGMNLRDYVSGTFFSGTTGNFLFPRLMPSAAKLTLGGSVGSAFQGAGNIMAAAMYDHALSDADDQTMAQWLMQFSKNRGKITTSAY